MKGYKDSMVVEGAGMTVWILHRKPHEMEIVGSRSEEAAPPISLQDPQMQSMAQSEGRERSKRKV